MKKIYKEPETRIYDVKSHSIICQSDPTMEMGGDGDGRPAGAPSRGFWGDY